MLIVKQIESHNNNVVNCKKNLRFIDSSMLCLLYTISDATYIFQLKK